MINDFYPGYDRTNYDKVMIVRILYSPIWIVDYLKLPREVRKDKEWLVSENVTREEIEPFEDFFYDGIIPLFYEYDFASGCYGGGGDEPSFDADFRRCFRYDHKMSKLLVIPVKRITLIPPLKTRKEDDRKVTIYVGEKKCRGFDEALEEFGNWLAAFKEETDKRDG